MHHYDIHADQRPYYYFTGRQRLDRAIHTLEGLVRGVGADGKVNDRELAELMNWVGDHREFADRHPFNEVIPVLQQALHDGVFDEEERYDVLWLCERLTTGGIYYDAVTADMQRLQGFLAGIIADRKIEVHELRLLQEWIDQHESLKSCWPYDEVESLLLHAMKDEQIDEKEHAALMEFFSEFTHLPSHPSVASQLTAPMVRGICAVCPEIQFSGRVFCFTGASSRATRKHMESIIVDRGGEVSKGIVKSLNYLVIGADGNPCWAYACYGRKVEKAMTLRREGHQVVLVHEHDYWDAIADRC